MKVSRIGNTNRGTQSHIHCSRLIFAAIASTNANSEAIKPPISAIAPSSPIQLSEMASDPPLENATINIAPANASSTTTAAATPTAHRATPLFGCAAPVFMKVWGETELPVIELTSFANPPRGADGLCESRFSVSSRTLENAMVRPMGREPDPAFLPYSRIAIDDNTLRFIRKDFYPQISAIRKRGSALGMKYVCPWIY